MTRNQSSLWRRVPPRTGRENLYHAVIEIPRGEKAKYEYRIDRDVLFLDRVLYSSVHYPENYGFIPGTLGQDGDPLDVLLFCQEPLVPLAVAEARLVGGLKMEDEKGVDDKILAVATGDPEYSEIHSRDDLPAHRMREVQHFFEVYKKLEDKEVSVHDYYDRGKALSVTEESIQEYRDKIDKNE